VQWLISLAHTYLDLGNAKRSIQCYEKGLAIAETLGHVAPGDLRIVQFARALLVNGNYQEAHGLFCQALAEKVPHTGYRAAIGLGITELHQHTPSVGDAFREGISQSQEVLNRTNSVYKPQYALATALVGQAVCDPRWADENQRAELLAPALEEYRRALDITAAPGVVQDAIRDLELIQAAGIEGLEPVFELLENAEYEPDVPEDLPNILENFLEEDRE
jgi:tetratricopeptide (TPR) repeat protein